MVCDEVRLVNDRDNKGFVTTAILTQSAIVSVLGGRKAREAFRELIRTLQE